MRATIAIIIEITDNLGDYADWHESERLGNNLATMMSQQPMIESAQYVGEVSNYRVTIPGPESRTVQGWFETIAISHDR